MTKGDRPIAAITLPFEETAAPSKTAVIDCDIHNTFPSPKALYPYLAQRWQRHLETFGHRGHAGGSYSPRHAQRRPLRRLAAQWQSARLGSTVHANATVGRLGH